MNEYELAKANFVAFNHARSIASQILKKNGMVRRQERKLWLDRHSELSPDEIIAAARIFFTKLRPQSQAPSSASQNSGAQGNG